MNERISDPGAAPTPDGGRRPRRLLQAALFAMVIAIAAAGLWAIVGKSLWSEYQNLRRETRATADSVPVGYVGLHYRRSYNDRPVMFHLEKDGRKLLFAAKGEGPEPEYYDVTEAAVDLRRIDGGFGRDSIPGVDYPIIDQAGASTGRTLRASQPVYGVELRAGPRAYPKDLIEKIEVVNDADGSLPIAVVFDRSRQRALVFERSLGGAAFTFGTTGYTLDKAPVLYDRKTRSLWLPRDERMVCFNGELKGRELAAVQTPALTTWKEWKAGHSDTSVLMGSDRTRPIPAE
jgi:hypothetical protein